MNQTVKRFPLVLVRETLGLSVSYQHLQPRMVYVTDQGFAVKPASHILRMLRAVTAPPVIRVGSLSGVAATLLCFRRKAAGRNVELKLCVLMGWVNTSLTSHASQIMNVF